MIPGGTRPTPSDFGPEGTETVCGLMVTYRPPRELLREALKAALPQLHRLIVIDNSASRLHEALVRTACVEAAEAGGTARGSNYELETLSENVGLARAYNIGIGRAVAIGADFVLLLDQDTLLHPGAVAALSSAHLRLERRFPVGAVGPVNMERDLSFLEAPADTVRTSSRYYADDEVVEQAFLMNSGMLFRPALVQKLGGYDPRYFVDAVDLELSLRIRSTGLRLFRIRSARAIHTIGTVETARFAGRAVKFRREPTFRHYYIARDGLRTVARYWRRCPSGAYLVGAIVASQCALHFALAKEKSDIFTMYARGLLDFLARVGGPQPARHSIGKEAGIIR